MAEIKFGHRAVVFVFWYVRVMIFFSRNKDILDQSQQLKLQWELNIHLNVWQFSIQSAIF